MRFLIFTISILLGSLNLLRAQTCCSGGVPVSANLGMPIAEKNQFQFSNAVDFNSLQKLKSGSQNLQDNSRRRHTNSLLMELGYSLTSRFSIDILGAFVQQRRLISSIIGDDQEITNGVGDLVTLAKYQLVKKNEQSLTLGIGAKWPIGPSNLRSKRDLPLNADLQPGSGAIDLIGWSSYSIQFAKRPTLTYLTTGVISIKGKNKKYFGNSIYQFGNEMQLSAGLADQFLIKKHLIDVNILFRFRIAKQDDFELTPLPNTGGQFLFLNPGITYWLSKHTNLFANFNWPLYSKVQGTQLVPSYQISFGVYHKNVLKKVSDAPSNI